MIFSLYCARIHLFGELAQLGERKVRNLEVRGSIPLFSTKSFKIRTLSQGSDFFIRFVNFSNDKDAMRPTLHGIFVFGAISAAEQNQGMN